MNAKSLILPALTAAALLISGCSPRIQTKSEIPSGDTLEIGSFMTVGNAFGSLTLREFNDALAADGLYYAAWSAGDAIDYENEDGDTVALYDGQLYLIAGEFTTDDKAAENKAAWLSAAGENYVDVVASTQMINGVSYDLISYRCGEDSPYVRGVSAFASAGTDALCAEFTCRDTYTEDLTPILTQFLETVVYH